MNADLAHAAATRRADFARQQINALLTALEDTLRDVAPRCRPGLMLQAGHMVDEWERYGRGDS